jgi:L-amino acid N-acyltransferase YncA
MTNLMVIRPYQTSDWPAVWNILRPVFREGETYPTSPDITEDQARQYWIDNPSFTYVAHEKNSDIVGTYYIKPNQPSLGAHVCNCGYVVSNEARRRGIASQMCEHSQREALVHGYRAMQYNLVVSTNEASLHLWKKHGFQLVGTLPRAFRHARFGYVDAFIMYKEL